MTGHLLAVEHAAAAKTFTISGGTWIIAILAAAAGAYLRWLVPIGIFVLYLITHSGGHSSAHLGGSGLAWIAIAAIVGYVGWQIGGRTMMRHIGEREYRNRLVAAKSISSIWKGWWGDSD
jgi:hypothetical protein